MKVIFYYTRAVFEPHVPYFFGVIMAFSLNKVIIVGNLGSDPEFRVTPQGTQICQLRVATNENIPDKSGGWRKETEWHRVVVFGSLAEYASKVLRKGSKVCIEGRNKTRQYERDGVTHFITEVIARNIVFLDPKAEREAPQSFAADIDTTSYYTNDIQEFPDAPVDPEEDDLPF